MANRSQRRPRVGVGFLVVPDGQLDLIDDVTEKVNFRCGFVEIFLKLTNQLAAVDGWKNKEKEEGEGEEEEVGWGGVEKGAGPALP